MKLKYVVAAVAACCALAANAGTIQVVDFESVPGSSVGSPSAIPDGYAGLDWSDYFYVIDNNYLPGTGYEYGAIGTWSAYAAWAQPISFSSSTDFDLKGLYVASAWNLADSVTIQGYNNGALLYSTTITVTNAADDLPQLFAFNYKGIDEVRFSGYSAQIVIDNIQLKVSAVPEPESFAMLLAGLGAIGFMLRRRKAD